MYPEVQLPSPNGSLDHTQNVAVRTHAACALLGLAWSSTPRRRAASIAARTPSLLA